MSEPREAVSGRVKKAVKQLDFKLMLDRAQEGRGRERMRAEPEKEEDFQEQAKVDEGAQEADKGEDASVESHTAVSTRAADGQEEPDRTEEDSPDVGNIEQVLYPFVAAVAQEALSDVQTEGDIADAEEGVVVLKSEWTESMRVVQEVDKELDALEVDTQLLEAPGTQAAPVVEGAVQNSQNVFDMLSFNEMMDPDLFVEQAPDQIINRIQQVATTANTPILEKAADVVLPQVVRGLATLVRDGMAEMRLQLDPADLGEIELRVRTMDGVVRGQMMVQQAEVKQLLDAQLNRLREALEEHGLELGGLDVDLARDQYPGDSDESGQDQDRSFSGRRDFDAGAMREESSLPRRIGDGEVDYLI